MRAFFPSTVIAALVAACSSSSTPQGHIDFPDVGFDTTPATDSAHSDSSSTDGATDGGHDSSVDAPGVDSSFDGAVSDSASDTFDAGPDLGPPIDAPTIDVKPVGDGGDTICETELAWRAKSASFDSTVTPSSFASQVNPLLPTGHAPVTIADQSSGSWTMTVTASVTGGDTAEHFPADHAASAMVPMARTASGFSTGAPETSAFLYVRDAAPSDVWIPISNVTVHATYGDSLCQSLSSATLDAVIPSSAASTPITTSTGATTLGALLGAPTSSSPSGWNVELTFQGEKVAVSFK